MQRRRVVRALAVPLAFTFLAASCGGSDDDGGDDGGDDAAPEESAADTGDDDGDDASEGTTPGAAPGDVDTSIARGEDDVERTYGGEVTFGLEAEAVGLRPWEDACGEPCLNIHNAIFDTLMRQQADGSYGPWLADSIESNEDFTVYTLTLRPDVTFHDGTPLTAQTIVDMFAVQQTGTSGQSAIGAAYLAGVEATGDLEVTYTLSKPNSAFPASLVGVLGRVFEPAAAQADPDGFSTAPVGTGPFVISSRDIDNETVVVRNENYWLSDEDGNQLPYLDSISFRPIPDEGTRLDALLSGTTNMMQTLRQGTIRDAREASGIDLYEFQGNNTGGGMFNTAVAPFDDVRVRRGLNLMNNQEAVIEALGGTGISLPSNQWFSPDSPDYTEEAAEAWPDFDFEAGVASIQEYIDDPARSDGKAPGEPIDVELSCPPDPTLIAAMQVLEQVWAGSGVVNVTLSQYDQATHITRAVNDEHRAHCWRWSSNQDPSLAIDPFVAPPEESVSNFPNLFNEESYELAQQATQTDDVEERKELYKEIMLNIAEDQQIWYSGFTATLVATDPSVQGINGWLMPDGTLGNGFPNAVVNFVEVWIQQ
jgi:peptide/nickel transport system substrate-binding protein